MSAKDTLRSPPACYRLRGRLRHTELTFLLAPGRHRIGSAEANDVALPVAGVSRNHARLAHHVEPHGESWFQVEDLESRNGTFVNGRRVTVSDLYPDDVVRFGPVELRLEEVEAGDAELAVILEPRPRDPARTPPLEDTTAYVAGAANLESARPELTFPDGCVIGQSAAMRRLYRDMEALLGADLPVLIEGETGVGKESIVRTLHLSSRRRQGPFVAVNCAAIPGDLLEAEMFGIGEKVATGVRKRLGKFRAAAGGTLFLDEIAEMPVGLQAKLLRALQEKEIQPLGGRPVPVDVWVLCATNQDLHQRVEKGGFRRDLYYRVAGSVIRVPPLRERTEDVPLLVEHFLRRSAGVSKKAILGVTVKALDRLFAYPWPGNVRELEHEVRRLAHRCADGQAIESSLLSRHLRGGAAEPPSSRPEPIGAGTPGQAEGAHWEAVSEAAEGEKEPPVPESLRLADHVEATERRVILAAIGQAGGNQRQAARLLEISRATFARKIQKLGIAIRPVVVSKRGR